MEITLSRLRELELIESKLQALENAGVDNWEGYSNALEEIETLEERRVVIENMVDNAIEKLEESLYEPSERGAGYQIKESAKEEVVNELIDAINKIIKNNE